MRQKISTLKTLLQKERVGYVVKQNVTSSIHLWVNSMSYTFFLNHKRNETGYAHLKKQRDKKTDVQIKNELEHEKKLKIVFVEDGSETLRADIVQRYTKNIGKYDRVIIVDSNKKRRGKFTNEQVMFYVDLLEFINNFSKYNLFIYFAWRDIFEVIKIIGKNDVFDDDEIYISKKFKFFLVKPTSLSFQRSLDLDNVKHWESFQSSLGDIHTNRHNVIEEPLMDNAMDIRLMDDVLHYIRLISMAIYSNKLGEDTLETKKRINNLEQNIKDLEIKMSSDITDEEIDEMNDILNNFIEKEEE